MAEWVALRHIFDVCVRDTCYEGGGETPGAVVDTGGSREAYEGHGIINFRSGKGTAATGIRQVWREQGRVRRG